MHPLLVLVGSVVLLLPAVARAVTLSAGDILVADFGANAIIHVDPATGVRTEVTSNSVGTGPTPINVRGVTVTPTGELFMIDSNIPAVLRVDPATGDRTIVSGSGTGSGPTFLSTGPVGISVTPGGALLVGETALHAVVSVDPATGDRTLVSGSGMGSGPALSSPEHPQLDGTGDIITADAGALLIYRIDPVTGDRTELSGPGVGSGPAFSSPRDIAFEASGDLVAIDFPADVVLRIDPTSGARSVVSPPDTNGIHFEAGTGSRGIAVDASGSILVASQGNAAIVRVDPGTGARSVVSGAGVGSGAGFGSPHHIALVPPTPPPFLSELPFFAIDCIPGTGPCRLLGIDFDGTTVVAGTLAPRDCDTAAGGSVTFTPSAIEGLAFDSTGVLWGTGDNAAQATVEYLFRINWRTGQVVSCQEMELGGALNVNDVSGLAPWSDGQLIGVDKPEEDLVFSFPPDQSSYESCDDPADGRSTGLARYPEDGQVFYAVEDGNQLFRVTRSGSSCTRTDQGVLDGHQGVNSLTAVPGGNLYGIDTVNNSLIEIDPDTGDVLSEEPLSIPTDTVHGLAYRDRSTPVPLTAPALALPILLVASAYALLSRRRP